MHNHPHKRTKAQLTELMCEDFDSLCRPLVWGHPNRNRFGKTPEPWDDIPVSALDETKHVWKHDQRPNSLSRYHEKAKNVG